MKRGAIIAILSGLAGTGALLLGASAWVASAQQVVVAGRATSIAEEQKALKEAKAQAQRARALSRQLEAQADAATRDADRLNAQADALAARVEESEADLRAGQARLAIINRLVDRQSARLAQQQGPLVRLTAALQGFARRPPVLALLQPGSLADTVHVRAAFTHILPVIHQRTADLRGELGKTRQLHAMTAQATQAVKDGRVKLAGQRVELNRLEAQKRLVAKDLSSTAAKETERALAMSERVRDIDALMGQVQQAGAVRTRLAALPGPRPRPGTPEPGATAAAAQGSGSADAGAATTGPSPAYRLPVPGTLITGMGELSDSGVRSRGITLATRPGAQVIAPARGRIAYAGRYGGFGQIVIIDHGDGWTTLLTDLARLAVTVGQDIGQGAPIGTARTGNHPAITIELRRQGRPVDIVAMMTVPS
ncbi:MAG: murein hydrolase activator EnvC [Sphingobium sp.]